MAYITKGIQLWMHVNVTDATNTFHAGLKTNILTPKTESSIIGFDLEKHPNCVYIKNLQEIGELGFKSASDAGFDKIEVTTLGDDRHVYVDGLIADGDDEASELTLKFLFDSFPTLKGLLDSEAETGYHDHFFITIPGSEKVFNIEATVSNVTVDSVAVNAAMTCTATFKVHNIEYGAFKVPTWTVAE